MNTYNNCPIVNGYPSPTAEQLAEADRLDGKAGDCYDRAEESFQRCDTDGFVTQYFTQKTGQENARRAEVLRQGGYDLFPALFERTADNKPGRRIRAKLINNQWGSSWAICDRNGKFTGKFFPAFKTIPGENGKYSTRSNAWKAGLIEAYEYAPARVFMDGRGTGLSGTCWVASKRTDGGYPVDAIDFDDRIQ
jgi:hypothetical protein